MLKTGFVLGGRVIDAGAILAPMSGVTDYPFRIVARRRGCRLAFTEMVSIRSIAFGNKSSHLRLRTSGQDSPLALQLFDSDELCIGRAFEKIDFSGFSFIDFNAACPAPKLTGKGAGAILMRRPENLERILKTLIRLSPLPVTLKIRSGYTAKELNAPEISRMAEAAGVSAIFIHGRTRDKFYSGRAVLESIKNVREAVEIPVVGSGDIFSARAAARMIGETGVAAVLAARGSLGNPWLCADIDDFLEQGKENGWRSAAEIAAAMREHFSLLCDFYGEYTAIMQYRKFFVYWTKGFSRIKELRSRAFYSDTVAGHLENIDIFEARAVRQGTG